MASLNSVKKKLLVNGGTGFLGYSICRIAIEKGFNVISLSRHGEPISHKESKPTWAQKVEWRVGDSLKPETYIDVLPGITSIIHTMGILLEKDYKSLSKSQHIGELVEGLESLLGYRNQNPLKRKYENSGEKITYESVNRDTAITVATQCLTHAPTLSSFLYISAMDVFPFIPSRYITSKRQAEQFILSRSEFRPIILRPGFMYSDTRPLTLGLANGLSIFNQFTHPIKKDLASLPFGKTITTPPLHIDLVARAALNAIEDKSVKGIFETDEIMRLSYDSQNV